MSKQEETRELLKKFIKGHGPKGNTMLATVTSVNEGEFTCVLDDDGAEYEDVRLRPVLDGNESITVFPKVGTWALAVRIEEEEDWMVIAVGEADKIKSLAESEIKSIVGTSEFTIDDGFLMKKGAETLKEIMDDLLEGIQQLTVNTNVGPSSVPINIATFVAIQVRVANLLN